MMTSKATKLFLNNACYSDGESVYFIIALFMLH